MATCYPELMDLEALYENTPGVIHFTPYEIENLKITPVTLIQHCHSQAVDRHAKLATGWQ